MSSDHLAERILRFVQAKGYRPQQINELARAMGIGEDEHGDFHASCKALMKTGRIVIGARNALMLPGPPAKILGSFRGNPRGFGFVVPDTPNSHGDLYVPAGATGGAITGDTVAARVKKRGKRGGKLLYEGQITAVLKRGQGRFVGELRRQFKRWFVVPDGNTLHVPIVVGDPGAKNARPGDQVVVEITEYPDGSPMARGVLTKVLGKRGEPGVDTLGIIEQYQLPGEFSEAVLEQAREAGTAYDPRAEVEHREDLRKQTIITIDPVDARDFDDAISVIKNPDGTTELGVHIADVAHFVRKASLLDEEAKERSNSVYLSDRVIPMLPEVLSNGVCSLQEHQPRLTKSVFITYDRRGKVKKARVANTMIRSTKRLTYEQAARILDGKPGRTSAKIVALLREMERLARTIQKRRLRDGMLVLELPEIELVYGGDGAVVDVEPADTSFTHTIIEMFMVEANEAVARLFADRKIPALRRIHDDPGGPAGSNLQRFLGVLGYEVSDSTDRFALQKLLDQVRGKPESFAVNLAVLRSMSQAEYSPLRIGHYALASTDYGHFTSPIRRYPDLTIHRLIDAYLEGDFDTPAGRRQVPNEEELTGLGNLCSANERRAEAAGRELKLVLILRLLEKHLGDEIEGVVTGVANVGVFVQLDRYLVDGLLRFDGLPDDWWEVDPSHGAVIGERTGRQITVGDRLTVLINRIDLPNRQLELTLAKPLKGTKTSREKPTTRSRNTKSRRGARSAARSTRKRRTTKPKGQGPRKR